MLRERERFIAKQYFYFLYLAIINHLNLCQSNLSILMKLKLTINNNNSIIRLLCTRVVRKLALLLEHALMR